MNVALRLVVVHELWQTMRTIFPQVALVLAAEALFACLVNNEAEWLLPENVRVLLRVILENRQGISGSLYVLACVILVPLGGFGGMPRVQ